MRDDFTKSTVERLAKRAGFLCSNPHCRMPTVGAAQGHDGVVNVGMAAHITAAAPGGPRYDPTLSAEQRRHYSNGIWLCQAHGKLIDSDEAHFSVATLREWKGRAEVSSFLALLSGQRVLADTGVRLSDGETVDRLVARTSTAAVADLAKFRASPGWPSHPIALSLRLTHGSVEHQFSAKTIGSAVYAFNELVIVAPPGTGKSTTLLQIADAILTQGHSIAIFVPLGEWAIQARSLLEAVLVRRAFESTTGEDLKLLADSGRLILTLDGWNELDAESRKRASSEVQRLKRDFPDLGIVISMRRQALDVPIAAPTVEIDALSEDQQIELAKALSGARGESLLDHAWRTPGVRELVAIPLYLTTLVTRTTSDRFPTTREEIIRLFIEEYETKVDKADELRRLLFGLHSKILTALAVEATRTSNTTISDERARAATARAVVALADTGQLTAPLPAQPTEILDGLVSYHLLVKSNDGVAFQHQQFQEWYASHYVEELLIRAANSEPNGREVLRPQVLNDRSWEESLLFACERLSRRDSNAAHAVASAILETLGIDPILAAEMIYRSSDSVWAEIKDAVVAFASRWHTREDVDRAVAFMIRSGRGEFASHVWPLVANQGDQVSYKALRCAGRFRPSVLGATARDQLSQLPEETRKVVLHEIAFYSGMDGMQLATDIALNDGSPAVQIAVVEALLFRRADRLASTVLRNAPDEVWRTIAAKGYCVAQVSEADVVERLRKERAACIETESDPLRKLALLLEDGADGADVGPRISALIEEPDFPGHDKYGGLGRAYQLYPREVTGSLIRRVEAAREVPHWALDVLRSTNIAIDDGPTVDLILRTDTPRRIADAAAIIAGPRIIRRVVDEIVTVQAALRAMSPPIDERTRDRFWRLSELIANANDSSFVHALLAQPTTDVPETIALLSDQLARHHSRDERAPLRIGDDARRNLTSLLARWVDALLASASAARQHLAEAARAVGRIASPELTAALGRLLVEDLARWRASRAAEAAGLGGNEPTRSDAHTSWTRHYRDAFISIGDDAVADLMLSYLRDAGLCGFGVDAAHALNQIWKKRRASVSGGSESDSPFSSRRQRVTARRMDNIEVPAPYAEAILAVVDDLATSASEESQRHALQLAAVAFTMPYGRRAATIDALLRLPQPPATKCALLKVLAEAGEVLPGDLVFAGLHAVLEEAKTKPWLLSEQNGWQLEEWLELLPFSDRAAETLDTLELLPRRGEPWQLRGLLSALARSPLAAPDHILEQLARNDARYLDEHDWFEALSLRGPAHAAQVLLTFIAEGAFVGRKHNTDSRFLASKLAVGMSENEAFRRELYQRYDGEASGPAGRMLEYAIAHAANDDGILLLVRMYSRQGRTEVGALEDAIRHVAVGERPSLAFRGAREQFSVGVADLRYRLFALALQGGAEGQLASKCLSLIDELRDEYGAAEAEPRHPDITADRPWPLVM